MYTFNVDNSSKLFFTSDTHFSHFNICRYCNRPFKSRSDMDKTLVENWNSVVPKDGIVVHCGDFMLPHDSDLKEYKKFWEKLNFKTMLHLRGNHDRIECGEYEFEEKTIIVRDLAMIKVEDVKIYAQHYPCLAFNGDYQVFGHIHTLSDGTCHGVDADVNYKLRDTQYDVGVDQNNYFPISYSLLRLIFLHKKNKMKNQPKFNYGDSVKFTFDDKLYTGTIYIIDKYGTFENPSNVSYDILVPGEFPTLYKHISEEFVEKI